ncbi:hypothetical protein AB4K20DRAFT_1909790 [Rhizopus microsporus]
MIAIQIEAKMCRDIIHIHQYFLLKAFFLKGNTRKNLWSKMPLVIFDNGLKNKSHVKFKRLRQGVSERVYRQLRLREKLGGLIFLDIDEHKTSKTCNSCFEKKKKNLENLQCDNGDKHKIH